LVAGICLSFPATRAEYQTGPDTKNPNDKNVLSAPIFIERFGSEGEKKVPQRRGPRFVWGGNDVGIQFNTPVGYLAPGLLEMSRFGPRRYYL